MNSLHEGLLARVFAKFSIGFVIIGALFFGTAGSFSYINGWVYLGTILAALGIGLFLLYRKDKALLEKRIRIKETDPRQKVFVALSGVLMVALYGIPGLDFRFGWTQVPLAAVVSGEFLLVVGYALNLQVMLTNSYASRVVELQEGQTLIDTGLYSIVRHPMYMSISLVYLGTCLVLGSYIALVPCIMVIVLLGFRAKNEEEMLVRGLAGYSDYMKRVKYRMIPFVW